MAEKVLVAAGADPAEARCVAEVLVWADARGRFPQGTIWLDVLCRRLSRGELVSPAPMEATDRGHSMIHIDCNGGLGHVAGRRAVDLVADAAAASGVAAATVRESSHFGPCGYYAARLAERGLIGIVATNAYPKVAVHGGRGPVLGTNPIAFAAPSQTGRPIVGDLSTGAIAGSRVREAVNAGHDLEPGVALDRDGNPTLDPNDLEQGGVMLPFGGAKGAAVGLLVEILTSVLADGAPPAALGSMFQPGPPRTSHFVLALSADGGLADRVDGLRAAVLAAERRPGHEVRLPGDHGHDHAAAHPQIELPPDSVAAVREAASVVGLEPAELGLN